MSPDERLILAVMLGAALLLGRAVVLRRRARGPSVWTLWRVFAVVRLAKWLLK